MAVQHGFGKTSTDGLIFAYDTGDMINSYKGKPTTNLLTTISKGSANSSLFKIFPGTETLTVPGMGTRTVHYTEVYNDYPGGSGNCCPAPMHFGDFSVSPSTTYTYQIVFRTTTGYYNQNYMYRYEYNGGTYKGEAGLVGVGGNVQDLGDGWRHAWGTFTTGAETNRLITYLFHYEYTTWNKIQVAGVMLTQGSQVLKPMQFLDPGASRSNTAGLLDLTGTRTLSLANTSFGPYGELVFDGTNDTIDTGIPMTSLPALSNFTMECIAKIDQYPPGGTLCGVLVGAAYYAGAALYWYGNSAGTGCVVYSYIRGADAYRTAGGYNLTPGQYHHLVLVNNYSANTMALYANGNLIGSAVTGPTQEYNPSLIASAGNIGISKPQVDGGGTSTYSYFNGQVPVVKLYTSALSSSQITQNYRSYKKRFNLS